MTKHSESTSIVPYRGRGNHRRGSVKGTKAGTRRGQLPASRDPLIIQRRAAAIPLWMRGHPGARILVAINAWLESIGEETVSLRTIYNDRTAILKVWAQDFEHEARMARVQHLATLNYLMTEHFRGLDASTDLWQRLAHLNAIARLVETIGKFDGTPQPGGKVAVSEAVVFERVYVGIDPSAV